MSPREAISQIKKLTDGVSVGGPIGGAGPDEYALAKVAECCACLRAHHVDKRALDQITFWSSAYFSGKPRSILGYRDLSDSVSIACGMIEAQLPPDDPKLQAAQIASPPSLRPKPEKGSRQPRKPRLGLPRLAGA